MTRDLLINLWEKYIVNPTEEMPMEAAIIRYLLRIVAAQRGYMHHDFNCKRRPRRPCSCGLTALLRDVHGE